MSPVTPQRRWQPTKTDGWILGIGVVLIVGGLVVVTSSTNDPLATFTANALLTVGVAIALVGIILRVQLDIQDELDDARRARLAFEQELRGEIAAVDERVRQVVEALRKQAPDHDADNARRHQLGRELSEARQRARELEAQIEAAERSKTRSGPFPSNRVRLRTLTRAPRRPRDIGFGDVVTVFLALGILALMTFAVAVLLAYLVQKLVPASSDNLFADVPISLVTSLPFAGMACGAFLGWDFGTESLPWRERLALGLVGAAVVQVGLVVFS